MEFMLLHGKWNKYLYIFTQTKGDSATMWALKELQFTQPLCEVSDKSYVKTALVLWFGLIWFLT